MATKLPCQRGVWPTFIALKSLHTKNRLKTAWDEGVVEVSLLLPSWTSCHRNQVTIATRYVANSYCPKEAYCRIWTLQYWGQKTSEVKCIFLFLKIFLKLVVKLFLYNLTLTALASLYICWSHWNEWCNKTSIHYYSVTMKLEHISWRGDAILAKIRWKTLPLELPWNRGYKLLETHSWGWQLLQVSLINKNIDRNTLPPTRFNPIRLHMK